MRNTELPDVVPADIPSALASLGIDFIIRGDEATALCPDPEHSDGSPSWSCNLNTGKHHCFSCGFGGSFEWLVRVVKQARKGEAVAWIRTQKIRLGTDVPTPKAPSLSEADLWEMGVPSAEWLAQRRISRAAARQCEVLFNHRTRQWVFPYRDPDDDHLIGWQEKGTGDDSGVVINRPAKLKKGHTLFGYKGLKESGRDGTVIVVESPIDVAVFRTHGIDRVVSTWGSSFSEFQVSLIWPYADEIVFALDNDAAGHKQMSRWIADNPFGRRKARVFNYGTVQKIRGAYVHTQDGRDPGDLSGQNLKDGVESATPASFTYFEGIDWQV